MSVQALNTAYCAFCDKVAAFVKSIFKNTVEGTPFDPKFDKKAFKQLNALSDYELRDIGITRGDIMHIAMGGEVFRGRN
jgi:1-aminocyclopropane-1-carboxylate deaminase/D-cysteine desulfhydrase-like pyridoxal-dependent ACC family enzyme